jgi:hypothetical protein
VEDAEAFSNSPGRYLDGAAALLDPTLQEDYGFPANANYPYVTIKKDDGGPWQQKKDCMLESLQALVEKMNSMRLTEEPPFVLVDLENDPTAHVSALGKKDLDGLRR